MNNKTTGKTTTRAVSLPAGGELTYELTRKKVRNVNMRVRDNGTVAVSASSRVSTDFIDAFVISHAGFIAEAKARFRQKKVSHALPLEFENGDTVRILGVDIPLVIRENSVENVDLMEATNGVPYAEIPFSDIAELLSSDAQSAYSLCISLKNPLHTQKKRQLFLKWRSSLAECIFKALMDEGYKAFRQFNVPVPTLRISEMKSRWGTCRPSDAVITLNSRLIEYPLPAIRYVVWHEYNHFLHPDHSAAFHASLTAVMPDWKSRKALLF